jgi:hypothetical protein
MNTTPADNIYKNLREIELYLGALNDGSFPSSLEIDLALAKLREIYEDVITVKKLREGVGYPHQDTPIANDEPTIQKGKEEQPAEIKQAIPSVPVHIPAEEMEKKRKVQERTHAPASREAEPTNEDKRAAPEVSEAEEMEDQKKVSPVPLTRKEKETERTIVGEKFQGNHVFMNEVVAQVQNRSDLSSRLQSKPIKNIPAAIGINDKFLFIKELFKGDAETYAETIKILELAPSFNDAFNYLDARFGWDPDDTVVQKLLDLVRRRHIG